MESLQAQWERKTLSDYDRRCCAEDAYNEAVEREMENIEEDISNGDSDAICAFREKMLDYDEVISAFDDDTFNDDEFIKAVALGTDYEEMRIKILTAMAEDRLEQLEEDYRKGFILND